MKEDSLKCCVISDSNQTFWERENNETQRKSGTDWQGSGQQGWRQWVCCVLYNDNQHEMLAHVQTDHVQHWETPVLMWPADVRYWCCFPVGFSTVTKVPFWWGMQGMGRPVCLTFNTAANKKLFWGWGGETVFFKVNSESNLLRCLENLTHSFQGWMCCWLLLCTLPGLTSCGEEREEGCNGCIISKSKK